MVLFKVDPFEHVVYSWDGLHCRQYRPFSEINNILQYANLVETTGGDEELSSMVAPEIKEHNGTTFISSSIILLECDEHFMHPAHIYRTLATLRMPRYPGYGKPIAE